MVLPVTSGPIVLNGHHFDIVRELHTFLIESATDNMESDRVDYLIGHDKLNLHILDCMRNHTTYFMLSNVSHIDNKTNEERKVDSIMAAMIVEKMLL